MRSVSDHPESDQSRVRRAAAEEFWAAPALGLSPLSRVRLDELLQELLDRVGEVMTSRERLSALLDVVVGVGSDLDLRSTLQRIVSGACRLMGARYGALGVIGPDRRLIEFITDGLTPEQHQKIGDTPTGRGVLGLLIDDPRPVRLRNIADHPRSAGFPPNHPAMRSFLGVPIRIRDQVFGNLYLTEKRGAEEFSADDEEMAVALAIAAGVAIENARLYAAAGTRQRWLEATAEITSVLLGPADRTTALGLVARRAREVADADTALLLLPDADSGLLRVEVCEPAWPNATGTLIHADDSPLAAAMSDGSPVVVEDLSDLPSVFDALTSAELPVHAHSALLAPLAAGDAVTGLLVVIASREASRLEGRLDPSLLSTFAAQAALALERARAQEERDMLLVLEDRDRIARDLHDLVIQRLFATGLTLQSAARLAVRPELAERVNGAVDDLDATIRDIRSAIFELRTPAADDLRTDVRATVDAAAASLGFRPELRLDGPLDAAVPDQVRPDLVAVLREALSNVVKHAEATRVTVGVSVIEGTLTVRVSDNGPGGVDQIDPRSGLVNMRERAARHGGSLKITPTDPTGITVTWTVQLH